MWSLVLMPEWYLVIVALAILSALSEGWGRLLLVVPLLALAAAAPVIQARRSAIRVTFAVPGLSRGKLIRLRSLTALLHLLQPLVRLGGRLPFGLSPWRWRGVAEFRMPWPRNLQVWSESWRAPRQRMESLEETLGACGAVVLRGGDYDSWDLDVRGGIFGAARVRMATEEHGAGRQLVRFRCWPHCQRAGLALVLLAGAAVSGAVLDHAPITAVILGTLAVLLAVRIFQECGSALGLLVQALEPCRIRESPSLPARRAAALVAKESEAQRA